MININIKTIPLSSNDEDIIKRYAVRSGHYEEIGQLEKANTIKILQSNENIIVSSELFDSIRSAHIQNKIIMRHTKLKDNTSHLYNLFKQGKKIIDLTLKYDFPPMSIIRQFLILKNSKKNVKELLKNPSKIHDEKLRNEIKIIEENRLDVFVTLDQSTTQDYAEAFEINMGSFLKQYGVKFKTQEELSQEQISKHGKAINTPDFLIESDLTINGKKINWIDAKNFYGADTWMINKSISKQTKKYVDEWGSGAIWFSLGFSEKLKINSNVYLMSKKLDSSS
jgi:hypothetical protein